MSTIGFGFTNLWKYNIMVFFLNAQVMHLILLDLQEMRLTHADYELKSGFCQVKFAKTLGTKTLKL